MSATTILIVAKDAASAQFSAVGKAAVKMSNQIKSVGRTIVSTQAAIAGAAVSFTVGTILQKSLQAWMAQEDASRALSTALRINQEDVGSLLPELNAFAFGLQRITTIENEVTQGLMRLGASLQIPGKELKGAAQSAFGLEEAFGIDPQVAMRALARARAGDFAGLTRYMPQLKAVKSDTEKLAIVNEVAAKGFELVKDRVNTTSGALAQMKNAFSSLFENLGKILAPAEQRFAAWMTEIIDVTNLAMSHWPEIFTLAIAKVSLLFETFSADVRHILTQVIPAYAQWLVNNWRALFSDLFNSLIETVKFFATSTGQILQRLWDYIASGMEGGFDQFSKDITDIVTKNAVKAIIAARSTVAPLPEVPGRQKTAQEIGLGVIIAGLQASILAGINGAMAALLNKPPVGEFEGLKPGDGFGEEKDKKGKKIADDFKAVSSRFLGVGSGFSHEAQTAKNTAQTAKELNSVRKGIDRAVQHLNRIERKQRNVVGVI